MVNSATQKTVCANGMTFALQVWGNPCGVPVIALHGWLDNSASFDFIAPLIPEAYFIAIDMAGHGLSEHRKGAHSYYTFDDVNDLFAIVDALGIQQFCLVGHSRGAIVATLAAGVFPDRIIGLVLLDGGIPDAAIEADAPKYLAASIQSLRQLKHKTTSLYPSLERAMEVRAQSAYPVSYQAAECLVLRGMVSCEGGYRWRHDQRLQARLAYRLTDAQIRAFTSAIVAPSLVVVGKDGIYCQVPDLRGRFQMFNFNNVQMVEGNHHLHLQYPERVAEIIRQFLGEIA